MEAITEFLEDFDFAKLLPEIGKFLSDLRFWTGVLMVLGPLVLLGFGLWYYFRPVQEPDERRGYRLKCAMASVKAWRYTQRLAAIVWIIAGGAMTLISIVICLILLGADELALMTTAVIWLIIEVILTLASHFVIRHMVGKNFDKDGNPIKE